MNVMDETLQDALDWLERQAAGEGADPSSAQRIVDLIANYESRENVVLGMCMARRAHAEIRDHLLSNGS